MSVEFWLVDADSKMFTDKVNHSPDFSKVTARSVELFNSSNAKELSDEIVKAALGETSVFADKNHLIRLGM